MDDKAYMPPDCPPEGNECYECGAHFMGTTCPYCNPYDHRPGRGPDLVLWGLTTAAVVAIAIVGWYLA